MANTLTQIGIETGNTVEAYHVSQSIDAFTGVEAYDISLSGSFNMTGSINGQPGVVNPLTASFAISSSYAITASHALNVVSSPIQTVGTTLYSINPLTSGFSSNNSIFFGSGSGQNASNASNSNFFGQNAGSGSFLANNSNFFGQNAGQGATNANNSNFLGTFTGQGATNASNSNFFGIGAGIFATNASSSNFIGNNAGFSAINSVFSNFIGASAGNSAVNASNSNFIGEFAGYLATNASISNFFGQNTGREATNASYSTLIGYQVGYVTGSGVLSIGSNNIIIGTNISLPNARNNSINLGGVIFATGSYSTTTGNPFTGSQVNSRVGIAKDLPNATLDINGNTIISGSLTVTGSQVIINRLGSKTSPSLYFGSDSDTGLYTSASNTINVTAGGIDTVRISPYQLIVGDENFRVNQNYAGVGLHVQDGWIYTNGLEPISSNIFFSGSNFYRGLANRGGYYLHYIPTGSSVDPADGEKFVFVTIPSGSITGSVVSQSSAFRVDVNYLNGSVTEPNFEIVNRLTLGQLWVGTNTGIGRDSTTGRITAVSSDQRLKTDIQTLTGSLDKVKLLRGTQFNWTNENEPEFRIGSDAIGTQIGLIAQEVEQVLPEVVKLNGVKDYKTVEYDKIVAVLIEAIKEQQQQIDNLQQQIDNLN